MTHLWNHQGKHFSCLTFAFLGFTEVIYHQISYNHWNYNFPKKIYDNFIDHYLMELKNTFQRKYVIGKYYSDSNYLCFRCKIMLNNRKSCIRHNSNFCLLLIILLISQMTEVLLSCRHKGHCYFLYFLV
jgi:hypothetical protein